MVSVETFFAFFDILELNCGQDLPKVDCLPDNILLE